MAEPHWDPPLRLATQGTEPRVAVAPDGRALALWVEKDDHACVPTRLSPPCPVSVRTAARGQTGWLAPTTLGLTGRRFAQGLVAVGGDVSAAVWASGLDGNELVEAVAGRAGEPLASPPHALGGGPCFSCSDPGALDVGSTGFVTAVRVAGDDIEATTRSPLNGLWTPPQTLDARPAAARVWPAVAVDAVGAAVAMWVEQPSACPPPDACGFSIRAGDFSPASGTWSTPYELASSAWGVVGVQAPSIDVDAAGTWHAIWLRADASGLAVEASSRPASATAWSPPVTLSTRDNTLSAPALDVNARGDAVVAWSRSRIVEASYRRAGGPVWSPPETVAAFEELTLGFWPRIGLDDRGNAVAAWAKSDGQEVVQAVLRPSGLGRWLRPVDLGPSLNAGVDLDVDATGDALAISSSTAGIDVARLDGRGPIVAEFVVPGAVRAGGTITLRATATGWTAPLVGEPAWSFGDGDTASGETVVHAYRRSGRYSVQLTVRDAKGDAATREASVDVVAWSPRNLGRPRVAGTPRADKVLACVPGTWAAAPPPTYRYVWLRNRSPIGTGARRRLRRTDIGTNLRCRVFATNEAGTGVATSGAIRIRRRAS